MLLQSLLLIAWAAGLGRAEVSSQNASPVTFSCPWLTAGTAAHALGGDISVTGSLTKATEGACRFSRNDQRMNSLDIVVGGDAVPTCPASSAHVVGVGNDAARCKMSAPHGEMVEMLSSRVRDVHFAVILHAPKHGEKSIGAEQDMLEQIAEQVAGSLF